MSGERQLPGLGLYGFWTLGSNGYKDQLDGNLRILSALVQGSVLSFETVVPGSPTDGDRHIITTGGDADKIAIRDLGAWVYLIPAEGWTIYDLGTATFYKFDGAAWVANDLSLYQLASEKGVASGYASLNGSGLVPASQLPSDGAVVEYANFAAFPGTGVVGTVYIALDTDTSYIWDDDGSVYVAQTSTGTLPSNVGFKSPCRLVATSDVDIATGGVVSIDGKNTATGYRVLLTGQTLPEENGIYVAAAGAWARATDANTVAEVRGSIVTVWQGTTYGSSVWFTTFKQGNTLGTTAMDWYQVAHGDNIIAMIDAILGSSTWQGGASGATFADNAFTLQDDSDATKQAQFQLSGITTGQTRVFTLPDRNGQVALVGTIRNVSATTDTPVIADANNYLQCTHASGCTITIPPNSAVAYPIGTTISWEQARAAVVVVAPGVGVTLNSRAAALTTAGQYAVGQAKKVATDTWTVFGDLV